MHLPVALSLLCHELCGTSESRVLLGCCYDQQLSAEQLCTLLIAAALQWPWVEFGLVLLPMQPVLPPCPSQCQHSSWSPVTWTARGILQGWSLSRALKRKERRKSRLVTPHTPWYKYLSASEIRLLSYIAVPRHLPPKLQCLCYSGKPCTALVWMKAVYRQHPPEQS